MSQNMQKKFNQILLLLLLFAASNREYATVALVVRKQASHTLGFSLASSMTESYKHCLLCYPTMAAQKCPWHLLGSQVAGGAEQNQEA